MFAREDTERDQTCGMGCEVLHVVFSICRGYLEDLNSPTGVMFDEGGELFLNVWTGVHFTHDRIVRQAGQDLRQLGTGSLTGADQNECRGGHQGGLARAGSLSDLTDLRSRMTLSTHALQNPVSHSTLRLHFLHGKLA